MELVVKYGVTGNSIVSIVLKRLYSFRAYHAVLV